MALNPCYINPLMPKRYFCTSIKLVVFKKQEAANTDLFNPLVPEAHNSECQNVPFPLQISQQKSVTASLRIFAFFWQPRH